MVVSVAVSSTSVVVVVVVAVATVSVVDAKVAIVISGMVVALLSLLLLFGMCLLRFACGIDSVISSINSHRR